MLRHVGAPGPSFFQLRRNQSVFGVAGGVAALCQRGLVAHLLQLEFRKRLFYPLLNDIGRFVWVCRW